MALRFRKKRSFRGLKNRFLLLAGVFAISFIIFEIVLNYNHKDIIQVEADETLPVISVESMGKVMGKFFGYITPMEATYMRNTLIPIENSREISILIETYGNTINGVSYELRSMDSSRKIAETKVTDIKSESEITRANIVLENLIEKGPEYMLILTIETKDSPVYYYIRIQQPKEESYEKACMEFALYFHETSHSYEYDELAMYVEPKENAPKGLAQVSLNSSLNQIGWRGFRGKRVGEPIFSFEEINESHCTVKLLYQMIEESEGKIKYYNVSERYRMRMGTERIFLLNFDRNMEEILNKDVPVGEPKRLVLGQRADIPDYVSNERGNLVAFVWSGNLYLYNMDKSSLSCIFSFEKESITDYRQMYNQHDISILSLDENGSIDFVVYGYMKSGEHVGKSGIGLYHYDSISAHSDEEAFFYTTKPYQLLEAEFDGVIFRSSENDVYLYIDNCLMKYNLTSGDSEVVAGGGDDGQIAMSVKGNYASWVEDEGRTLVTMDLETGVKKTIESVSKGEMLRVLHYVDEDLVYGKIRESDTLTDASGNVQSPMYELVIYNAIAKGDGILKTFSKEGRLILDAEKESDKNIKLNMVKRSKNQYVSDTVEIIQNTSEISGVVNMENVISEDGINRIAINFNRKEDIDEPKVKSEIRASINLLVDNVTFELPNVDNHCYYAYAGSEIVSLGTNLLEVIQKADEAKGFVVDNSQTYIWQYGRTMTRNSLSPLQTSDGNWDKNSKEECIDIMLEYEGAAVDEALLNTMSDSPAKVLASSLPNYTVVDLTGTTLDQMLSYISRGYPVYTEINNEALLLIGYDTSSIVIYSPTTNAKVRRDKDELASQIEKQGSHYITYVKRY